MALIFHAYLVTVLMAAMWDLSLISLARPGHSGSLFAYMVSALIWPVARPARAAWRKWRKGAK